MGELIIFNTEGILILTPQTISNFNSTWRQTLSSNITKSPVYSRKQCYIKQLGFTFISQWVQLQ